MRIKKYIFFIIVLMGSLIGSENLKEIRAEDNGSMECGYISCTNCNFTTDCDLRCNNYKHIKIYQKGSQFFFDDDTTN